MMVVSNVELKNSFDSMLRMRYFALQRKITIIKY